MTKLETKVYMAVVVLAVVVLALDMAVWRVG